MHWTASGYGSTQVWQRAWKLRFNMEYVFSGTKPLLLKLNSALQTLDITHMLLASLPHWLSQYYQLVSSSTSQLSKHGGLPEMDSSPIILVALMYLSSCIEWEDDIQLVNVKQLEQISKVKTIFLVSRACFGSFSFFFHLS